jgi:hypothetical protein
MLQFIYTDNLNKWTEVDIDLLAIANTYEITSLQIYCEKKLCEELDIGNVLDAWIGADFLSCKRFSKACEDFILAKRIDVNKNESFSKLIKAYPEKIAILTTNLLSAKLIGEKGQDKKMPDIPIGSVQTLPLERL